MKEISIQQLQDDTSQWARLAAHRERMIIADGQPLTAFEPLGSPKRLLDREDGIKQRSLIKVDSADYVSEMRG